MRAAPALDRVVDDREVEEADDREPRGEAPLRLARASGQGREATLKATLARIRALPSHATAGDAIAEVDALEHLLSEISHEP